MGLLTGLGRSRGTPVLAVTHSADVARLADRVFTLADGRLTEQGRAA